MKPASLPVLPWLWMGASRLRERQLAHVRALLHFRAILLKVAEVRARKGSMDPMQPARPGDSSYVAKENERHDQRNGQGREFRNGSRCAQVPIGGNGKVGFSIARREII